jgi:threonine/homoserine/homoserine lactone efflux protein
MEQFLAVAVAHFLALLIPGVDFFLVARTAMTSGWRNASGVCVGIAAANGILITAAFSGLSMISHPIVLSLVQAAGGIFLVYIGIAFFRARVSVELARAGAMRTTWV